MGNSLFGRHIDNLTEKKSLLERELHSEIEIAVESFAKETELDSGNIYFNQYEFPADLNKLSSDKGVMSFRWGIVVEHKNGSIEVSCPVNVVKKTYFNAPDEIAFSVGDYDPNAAALPKPVFMKRLVDELLGQISLRLS